jgi:single-strand DNA-binding protein
MSSINIVVLSGFVGQDPQITNLDNGVKVANFSLATSHPYKNKAGEKVDQTFWHRIVAFRGGAEIVEKYVNKGSQIAIQGQLKSRSYEDKEGKKHTIVEVHAEQIQLLGSRPSNSNNEFKANQQVEASPEFTGNVTNDDLPF